MADGLVLQMGSGCSAVMSFFAQRVQAIIDRTLSPDAQSRMLADAAKKALNDAIQSGRGTDSYRKWVDGHEGAREETVKPTGTILYRFNRMGAIAQFALSYLINRSPVRSSFPISPAHGKPVHYRDGLYVAVDGKFILAHQFAPNSVPATAEISIGNVVAYSRKVDIQLIGGKRLSFSTAPFLFDDAVREIKKRFGVLVEVKRVYTLDHPLQYTLRKEQKYGPGKRQGRARGRIGSRVESPALIISPMR